MEERVPGYCALCISHCGCTSIVEDGRLTAVEPDPAHPTGSAICIKAMAAPDLVYSSERLTSPLRRTTPKGDDNPNWEAISWDEALTEISSRVNAQAAADGPESVAFSVTTPSGTAIADSFPWVNRLAHAFGSPNTVFATENCNWHKDFMPQHTFGTPLGMPDYELSGCILLWGFNPSTSWLAQARAIKTARKNGTKLIVVDPRSAGFGKGADQWLRVRPGSDGILAMALASMLIENGWFDREFIRDWSNGPFLIRDDNDRFLTEADLIAGGSAESYVAWNSTLDRPVLYDTESATYRDPEGRIGLSGNHTIATIHGELHCRTAFQRYSETCREYSGPEIETVTGVSPTQLYETAKLIHQYGPLSYYTWTGTAQNTQATQTGRAMALLYALTGALDAAGGNTQFERPQLNNVFGHELLSETQRGKTLGLDERPLGPGTMGWISSRDLYSAISDGSPYPVKALISFGANPLLTKPAPHAADAALRKLDFHVHCDLFMNPSAANADIVLPVCSAWEREGLNAGFQISQQAEAYIQLRPAVVEPRGDSRSDEWIVFELAKHLGLGEQFFNGDHEAALRHQLEPSGVTLEALREAPRGIPLPLRTHYRKYRHQGFNTPSRRIELYSQVFLDSGYPPLPEFIVEPAKNSYYPLLLTSAKTVQYCHSQQRNLPLLRKSMPRPLIDIHPNTANVFGIAEHDEVVVTTDEGVMNAEARFNSSLAPDVLCSQYGWWQACNQLGIKGYAIEGRENGNYNNLISDKRIDPISSSNTLRHSYCKIKRRAEATTPQ